MLTFIDQNLAPGFSFSFLTLEKIKDSILNYIIFLKCDFSLSRAIQILESSNISIEDLSFVDSKASKNDLLHLKMSKDLKFKNINVQNVTNDSRGK